MESLYFVSKIWHVLCSEGLILIGKDASDHWGNYGLHGADVQCIEGQLTVMNGYYLIHFHAAIKGTEGLLIDGFNWDSICLNRRRSALAFEAALHLVLELQLTMDGLDEKRTQAKAAGSLWPASTRV